MVKIISFEDKYQPIFRSLNEEWLDLFHLKEEHDMAILNNPKEMILDTGGAIFLAQVGNQIVGSAALIKEHEGVYELVKMAVAPDYRSKGIGQLLIEKSLEKAKQLKATKVLLFSNHQLKSALKLYEKFGFKYIPVEDSPFQTADIKMELIF